MGGTMNPSQFAKYKTLFTYVMACIALYLSFRYLLPLFLPFILAYACAVCLHPCVLWLREKTHLPKTICAMIPIILFLGFLIIVLGYILRQCYIELCYLLRNWNFYEHMLNSHLTRFCCSIEKTFSFRNGSITYLVENGISDFFQRTSEKIIPAVMNFSIPTMVSLVEILGALLIFILSTFFLTKDLELFRYKKNSHLFSKEMNLVTGKLRIILTAYFKAQLIIMLFTSLIMFIGLSLCHNSYALLCSIIVGFLDALPMIGCGAILIPWALIMLLMSEYFYAVMLVILFIICYLVRQYLEPKIIGNKIGIHPVESLLSLYIGYRLFGLAGFILGPIGYLLLKEIHLNKAPDVYQTPSKNHADM